MSRLNLAPDMLRKLSEARAFLDQIKNKQTAGADNLKIQTNLSVNTFDYSASFSSGFTYEIPVTFTANAQENAFTDLLFSVGTTSSSLSSSFGVIREHMQNSSTPKVTTWSIYYTAQATGTHYFKFYVKATDSGVVS